MTLWTAKQAAGATGGQCKGDWQAERVVIDSRIVQPGDLFVVIKGERFDAHQFVPQALEAGAVAAIVSEVNDALPKEKQLVVKDTMQALVDLGKSARARARAKIIGVTGSVGKTSMKEMLKLAFAPHGSVHASHGNFNNHIGTPLNLANLSPDADFAIFEMGMNHAGEIRALVAQVQPYTSIITNVEGVHLEFFASVDDIAKAKCEIFEGTDKQGTAIINADNPYADFCHEQANKQGVKHIVSFGKAPDADFRLIHCDLGLDGTQVTADADGEGITYRLSAIGEHWAQSSLAALAAVHSFGLPLTLSAEALKEYNDVPGRGRLHRLSLPNGKAMLIDDSYNASPAAMRASFAKLKRIDESREWKGRTIVILGDMLELGEAGPQLHADLSKPLMEAGVNTVYTTGPIMRYLHDALPDAMQKTHVGDADELLALIKRDLRDGDITLIKGSHGSGMHVIAKALLDEYGSEVTDKNGAKHAV